MSTVSVINVRYISSQTQMIKKVICIVILDNSYVFFVLIFKSVFFVSYVIHSRNYMARASSYSKSRVGKILRSEDNVA